MPRPVVIISPPFWREVQPAGEETAGHLCGVQASQRLPSPGGGEASRDHQGRHKAGTGLLLVQEEGEELQPHL